MKKNIFAVIVLLLVASPVLAGECHVVNPTLDGNDVLLPDMYVRSIKDFDPRMPVIATTNTNGWLVRTADGRDEPVNWQSPDRIAATTLVRGSGNCWIARGMRGVRFGVAQQNPGSAPRWAKIENYWVLPGFEGADDFVVEGPALLVK